MGKEAIGRNVEFDIGVLMAGQPSMSTNSFQPELPQAPVGGRAVGRAGGRAGESYVFIYSSLGRYKCCYKVHNERNSQPSCSDHQSMQRY